MKRALQSVVHFVSWHRRTVGALLAAASILLLGQSLSEPDAPGVPVVVVGAVVEAGEPLSAADIQIRHLPADALPDNPISATDEVVGRVAAVALAPGTILQPAFMTAGHGAEPGRAIVPVFIANDDLRGALRPGDQVSLVAPGHETVDVISRDARITSITATGGTDDQPLALGGATAGGLVMIDVAAKDAPLVAALGQERGLSIVFGAVE